MPSAVDIVSQALVKLGDNPIASFDEGTTSATMASAVYATERDALLSTKDWGFAVRTEKLAATTDHLESDYDFQYQIPDDFIRAVSLGLSDSARSKGIEYDICENRIYTDADGVYLKYVSRVDENYMPAFFVAALVDKLAAVLCIPITDNSARSEGLSRVARLSEQQARLVDGQQRTPKYLDADDLIRARY